MRISSSLRSVAAAAVTSVAATLAVAGPLASAALAARPSPTPPITGLSGPAQPTSTSHAASFTWDVAASTSYSCALDGAKASSCTPTKTYTGLADGSHTFVLKATKAASGGTRYKPTSASYSWAIDTTPPATPTVTQLADTRTTSASISFTSDPSAVSFECQLDTVSPVVGNVQPRQSCRSGWPVSGLTDARYRVSVWASDSVGNTSAAGTMEWSVDSTAPETPTIEVTQAPLTNLSYADASFTTNETSTFSCSLDRAAATACPNPAHFTGLGEGNHTLTVVATDTLGNKSNPASVTWYVDLTAPVVSIVSGPASTTNQRTASFTVSVTDTSAKVECSLDGAGFTSCAAPISYFGLADGQHTFALRATDAAGNVGVTPDYYWTVNTTAPAPAYFLSGPQDPTNSTTASFDWDATDPTLTTGYSCQLDGSAWPPAGSSAVCDPTNGTVDVTGLSEGSHVFAVSALNGTVPSAAVTYSWHVDTTAPTAPVFSTTPSTSSTTALFSFASDLGVQYTCSLDGAAATLCASPVTYSGLAVGGHTFTVWATDAAGNGSHSDWAWTIDTSAPAAPTVNGPSGFSSVDAATITWSDTDAVTSSTCQLDTQAALAPCPGTVGTGPLADGGHTFSVTVSNGSGHTSTTTINWVVDTVAPVLHVADVPSGTIGVSTVAPTVTQTELHPGAVACSLSGPVSATNCGPFVNLPDGAYALTVDTTDLAGNVAQRYAGSWTVYATAPAQPTLTVKPDALTASGTGHFEFTDDDATAASFRCATDGADYVACSGPQDVTVSADGSHTFAVEALNSAGASSLPATYSWTVDTTPPAAPTITDGPTGAVRSTSATFTFTGDADTVGFLCAVDGQLPGACSPGIGVNGLSEGPHTFNVWARDAVGNRSAAGTAAWTVDTTGPAAPSVTTGPSALTSATSASFGFSGSAEAASYLCSLDGAAAAACTPGDSYTGLADGAHSFVVWAQDALGNTSAPSPRWTWTVDSVRPTASQRVTVSLTLADRLSFSEDVVGVGGTSVSLRVAGSTSNLPVQLACFGASGSPASCSGPVRSVTLRPTTPLMAGQYYAIAVGPAVTDVAGNPVDTAALTKWRASTVEQENSPSASTGWRTVATTAAYGRSYTVEHAPGAAVSIPFAGSWISWYTVTGRSQGVARVYVDNVLKATVNNFATSTHWHVARTITRLSAAPHVLRIVVTGLRSRGATDSQVVVDAIRVGSGSNLTPRGTYAWERAANAAASGRAYSVSNLAGAAAYFTFRGTAVTWYTATAATQGYARVYIDGVYKGTFDNYSARTRFGVGRTFRGLKDGVHTVRVLVLGGHRAGGHGSSVVIDRWNVA